jgi:HSP20 family protein
MLSGRSLNSTMDRVFSLNRVFDEALAGSWNGSQRHAWMPALDVVERSDAYLIALDVPSVDPTSIDITFEQNVLTIRGARAAWSPEAKDGEFRVYAAERGSGDFERSVHLPEFVDGDSIQAEYSNGTLHLTVPKARQAQARKIPLKGVETKRVEA